MGLFFLEKKLMKGAIRKPELLKIVPLSESNITALEKAGEFPKRFPLTGRTVAWNLDEVEAWLDQRQQNPEAVQVDESIKAKFANNRNHRKAAQRGTMQMAG